jgi:hypothetical protein
LTPLGAVRTLIAILSQEESTGVLSDLLTERPGLADDVRRLAESRLAAVDPAAVEQQVVDGFNRQHFTAIAERVGRRDGGYIDEVEAASMLLEERLEPYCREVVRLADAGLPDAAVTVGMATLSGLYRLREEAIADSLLGWVATAEEAWELATSVVIAFDDAKLTPPTAAANERFPDWAGIA